MELGIFELTGLPNVVAIAVVAVLGYLFGRRKQQASQADPNQMRQEMTRSKPVVDELERIAQEVRRNLAAHQGSILKFRDRLNALGIDAKSEEAQQLCREAELLLTPTTELVANMSDAYEALRRQSSMLMSFTELRTDRLTGLSNRQTLSESIHSLFAMQRRYHSPFALAIFDIDQFQRVNEEHGREQGDMVLKQIAGLLESCVRETDIVARFGGAEFVVVMPETDLAGAAVLARRIRRLIEQETEVTLSSGLALAAGGDNEAALLSRADKAVNGAKAAGCNCIFQHDGLEIEAVASTQLVPRGLDVIVDEAEDGMQKVDAREVERLRAPSQKHDV